MPSLAWRSSRGVHCHCSPRAPFTFQRWLRLAARPNMKGLGRLLRSHMPGAPHAHKALGAEEVADRRASSPSGVSVEVHGVVHHLGSGLSKGGIAVRQRCGLGIEWTVSPTRPAGELTAGSSFRPVSTTSGGGRHFMTILRSIVWAGLFLLGHDSDLHRACVN